MQQIFLRYDGVILAAVSPFLMFPTVFIPGTAVALLTLALLWVGSWAANKEAWPAGPLNGALLLWAIGVLVGTLVSADPDLTLPKATGLLLGMGALRFLSVRTEQTQRLKWGVAALFLFGVLFATVGVLSVDWQVERLLVESLAGWLPPQLISLPEGPDVGVHMNQLAGSLLPYPLILASLLWGRRPKSHSTLLRFGLAVLLISLVVLLFLTQSRSGWLGLGMGLAALLLMHLWWGLPRLRRGMVAGGGGLSAVFLLAAVLYTHTDNWADLWQRPPQDTPIGDLSTLDFRREVWSWGITAVEESPLTGIGLGAYRRVAPQRYPLAIPSDFDIAHVHNIFLQVLLDTGLVGLVGYLGLLILTAVIGWRAAGRSYGNRPLLLGLLAGLAAIHGFGLGDALAPGAKPGIIFWLMVGLIIGLGKLHPGRPAAPPTQFNQPITEPTPQFEEPGQSHLTHSTGS